jgi:hypothetical protein
VSLSVVLALFRRTSRPIELRSPAADAVQRFADGRPRVF